MGPDFVADNADLSSRVDVNAENGVNLRVVHNALFDHQCCSAFLAQASSPSSAGWNMKTTVPLIFSFHSRKNFSHTHESIATCVSCPHACITPTFWPLNSAVSLDANGKEFGYFRSPEGRPCPHEGRTRVRLHTFQDADNTGFCDTCAYIDTKLSKMVLDILCRLDLTISKLRILVQMPTPFDDLRHQLRVAA